MVFSECLDYDFRGLHSGHFGTMNQRRTVLAQILGGLTVVEFARCAARYPMRRGTSAISPFDHFAAMVFAQLTYRESLRLLSLAAAFKVLLADDHYTTLLRAEQMDTMPKFLAERASQAA